MWSTTKEPIGFVINNVVLGYPVETERGFEWDDSRLPTGEIQIIDGVALILEEQ